MSNTEARRKAHDKYQAEKVDVIYVRVPKGKKGIIQQYAKNRGVSVNNLINDLIEKELKNQNDQSTKR